MALQLVFSAVKGEFDQALRAIYQPIAAAATGAIKDAAAQVKTEGRAAIANGGFGRNFQNALQVNVYPKTGTSANAAALAFHKIPYAGVFQTGADISGKPLLWVPVSDSPARASGQWLTPKTFPQLIGPLVAIKSKKGLPILASPISSGRASSRVTVARLRKGQRGQGTRITLQPIFIGLSQVRLTQRFDLLAVFRKAQAQLGQFYLNNLKT
jgi:hypothetical protein